MTYVAGEGHYGPIDTLLERLFEQMVTTMVPDAYDVSVSYAKATSKYCPPPGRLADTVLEQLGGTAMLFNYVGHGSATRFDALHWAGTRVPVLRTDDFARLEASGDGLSLALLTCCSAGWYDMPDGNQSLAEGMLFHPAGPVAVVAGSRNTHPYPNTVLQKEFTQTLYSGRPETIGALDLAAMQAMLTQDQSDRELDAIAAPVALFQRWPSSLAELRETHVRLYNLLGDPSMRLTLPADDALEMERDGAMIAGRVTGMDRGRIVVTVETARTELAHPDRLIAVTGPDDPDLDAKAARNYVEANNRILLRAEGRVRDGRFELKLADSLPDRAAFIKAYAWGTTPDGEPFDAVAVKKFTAEGRGPAR